MSEFEQFFGGLADLLKKQVRQPADPSITQAQVAGEMLELAKRMVSSKEDLKVFLQGISLFHAHFVFEPELFEEFRQKKK